MTRIEEIEKAAREYNDDDDDLQKYEAFKSGARWADTYPIHYDGQGMLHVLHKGVEQGRKKMLDKTKSLIKEWELCNSAEAKYKVEAYKELMEIIEKEDKE